MRINSSLPFFFTFFFRKWCHLMKCHRDNRIMVMYDSKCAARKEGKKEGRKEGRKEVSKKDRKEVRKAGIC